MSEETTMLNEEQGNNGFASISDIIALYRPLTLDETTRATSLIPIISDILRNEAHMVGKDLDEMATDSTYANVLKSVIVDIIARILQTPTKGTPLTQLSESVNGYTFSGTPLSAGGGIFIKRDELKRLGLRRQRIGVIDFA